MTKRNLPVVEVRLEKIVGGGQALGTLEDGRKVFLWGGLPGELVKAQLTKKKSRMAEGFVTEVLEASEDRTPPVDTNSYLSTSPWQIMTFDVEQKAKRELIIEAFTLHDVELPNDVDVYSDGRQYHYRNKVEFSWYGQDDLATGRERLDLAFFRRGSKGKVIVEQSALLPDSVIILANSIRQFLEDLQVSARSLKTLLIRCDQKGNCVWQLYIKTPECGYLSEYEAKQFPAAGGEVIYSNPQSPASVITKRLLSVGDTTLTDTVLDVPFRYATEGFFQVNIPVYEQALRDMQEWVPAGQKVVDMYSGVGTIGLTIGGDDVTLVEVNEHAVREMRRNLESLNKPARVVLAASETALEHITQGDILIVDPPRAGLHADVIQRVIDVKPPRIIYLSCNPVTQARDVALLLDTYRIVHHKGYNFFPRTPHIEHLVLLDRI